MRHRWGVYSKQHKRLKDIPDGAVIAVPGEAAAFGRALFLMQEAGLMTLKKGFTGTGSTDMIKDNPKHLTLKTETKKNAYQAAEHADASSSQSKRGEKSRISCGEGRADPIGANEGSVYSSDRRQG